MAYHLIVTPRMLHFRRPAGTSRGSYTTRQVWYVTVSNDKFPGCIGVGECAPLPQLSCDDFIDYAERLTAVCRAIEETGKVDWEQLRPYPSMTFGLETAFRHFERGSYALWDTPFAAGKAGIPINGLIWMGSYQEMREQIEAKIKAGYRCIKLKIGAISFEEELALLSMIQKQFTATALELRVDANGAFTPEEALEKLQQLAQLDVHSIEQPIMAGQWEAMRELCVKTPLPIALDEELIGINSVDEKRRLLETIRPQYIILKPSLHGGWRGCEEWIEIAKQLHIGWWITSALESNIGLNAIAQWTATLENPLPQGLGTGALFTDNIKLPLEICKDCLWFNYIEDMPYKLTKIQEETQAFLMRWHNSSLTMTVQTSGSTGEPKVIEVRKESMKNSARSTIEALRLRKGMKALLCLPLAYIAGQMMVVRSLEAGMQLVLQEPSGHPLAELNAAPDFVAMVPLQVYNSLQTEQERKMLSQIEVVIIGGGIISPELETMVKELPNRVYATYGMTETLSHIALRRLNGAEASANYTPLPGVTLSLSEAGTLIIDAPGISQEPVVTNDLATIHPDGTFHIIGRIDNRINTGGIKVQLEELETELAQTQAIPMRFAITSVPDEKLGEAIVLLVERPVDTSEMMEVISRLPINKYHLPKHIIAVDTIPLTGNGKIDRAACRQIAQG